MFAKRENILALFPKNKPYNEVLYVCANAISVGFPMLRNVYYEYKGDELGGRMVDQ
jgi:hypothetical protein